MGNRLDGFESLSRKLGSKNIFDWFLFNYSLTICYSKITVFIECETMLMVHYIG